MARRPSPSASLRRQYHVILELSLVASLVIVIGVFAAPIRPSDDTFDMLTVQHEVVQIEEIEQTRQWEAPPPPPSMPPPIEVPDEDVTETVVLNLDMDLDLNRVMSAPPPPPPPPSAAPPPPPPAETEPEIFVVVEQMPQLIGGVEAVQALIRYPEMARRAGIEGTVHLQVVVNKDGSVSDPVCVRDPGGGTCEAAIEAIRQVGFVPGRQRGNPVRVRFAVPVRFRLQG